MKVRVSISTKVHITDCNGSYLNLSREPKYKDKCIY